MPRHKIPKDQLISILPESIRVKYRDVFDTKQLYRALHHYLLEHDWTDTDGDSDHWESYYGERVGQNGAKEIWFWWRLTKDAPDSTYLQYYLDIDAHLINITNKEIIVEGKKFAVQKGEIELTIRAYIDRKYESEFKGNSILKSLRKIFNKRIYHKTIEVRKKDLYQETYALQHFIKEWLKLKRYLPYTEAKTFYPPKAWPSHVKEG